MNGYAGQLSRWILGGLFVACLLAVIQFISPTGLIAQAQAEKKADSPEAKPSVISKFSDKVDPAIKKKIVETLQQGRSELKYTDIKTTPIPGLYQLQVERGPLLYVSADGEYFIAGGELYNVLPGKFVNLREEELKPQRAEMLAKVKREDQIIFSPKGETKAYINVFTDVDCGYCRKLHNEVPALNAMGIEVRYLAYPRAGLKSMSYKKIATAWCAENPQETLTKLKNSKNVDIKVCDDNPVSDQYALGAKVGVRGTPALVLSDGSLIAGYMSAKELAKTLDLDESVSQR